MRLPIYLDYMATTPVDPEVAKKMWEFLTPNGKFGNPASRTHSYGYEAEFAVENARQQFANAIHAETSEIIWTSGGTESINLAVKGAARFYRRQGNHLITFETEHKAVLDTFAQLEREGFDVSYIKPQPSGLIDLQHVQKMLRKDTILLSILHVNNEIGVIQNIAEIGKLTRAHGILMHVDASQSLGKIPIHVHEMNIDMMSCSAHKIYGPKGIGALYLRRNPRIRLEPLMHGGGQEQGLRPGTLAVHQIAGFGKAIELAQQNMQQENARILKLRQKLLAGISGLNIRINGDLEQRLPGNLNVSFIGIDGTTLIQQLANLAVSSGSACSSGSSEPSHVLKSLGVDSGLARSAIRFSIGRFTTEEEIEFAIQEINHNLQIK
jgi:cysteine desulfurase